MYPNNEDKIPAAMYIRMSTEHQKYSPENQAAAIREYADHHNYEIIRTYTDGGKSGLNIAGRAALQQMLSDVQSHQAEYKAILVLDVTRWGRFQDADESAYYEYICKRAGTPVKYCNEQFDNDGSPVATIVKGVKRTMAAEYSRELSCKVFAGKCRLINLGYRQGGFAGFGLRRMLVNEHGEHKGILVAGEHKSIATDRVILVPGPEEEQKIVRWMYKMFTEELKTEQEIADILNQQGILTDLNRSWTKATVNQVLTNEKYIGNNVSNRISFKLKTKRVVNPESEWIRKEGAFEAIVDPSVFYIAKGIINARAKRFSNDELLQKLKDLQAKKGYLSALIINESPDMPSSSIYSSRFGSLVRAYQLIGYDPERDYSFIEINRFLRELHKNIFEETISKIQEIGGDVKIDAKNDLLNVNDYFTASIVICRCKQLPNAGFRWKVRFDTSLFPDITIAVRMAADNKNVLDYYLLPALDFRDPKLLLAEENKGILDSYRFPDLSQLFEMARRNSIRYWEVA